MDYEIILQILKTEYLPRFGEIVLAGLLGGLIGLEREHHGQAAGFRTNMIVGLGACLLMQLSLHLEATHMLLKADSVIRMDPGRIASYAIASMGFLGAGAIIKGKGSIRGLTTAASMWLITGIGLCVGAGVIYPAIAVTFISAMILYSFPLISKKLIVRRLYISLTLEFDSVDVRIQSVKDILQTHKGIRIQHINYERDIRKGTVTYQVNIMGKENICWQDVSDQLASIKKIKRIAFEDAEVF